MGSEMCIRDSLWGIVMFVSSSLCCHRSKLVLLISPWGIIISGIVIIVGISVVVIVVIIVVVIIIEARYRLQPKPGLEQPGRGNQQRQPADATSRGNQQTGQALPARSMITHAQVRQTLSNIAWPSGSQSNAPAAKAATGARPRMQLGMAINHATGPCISQHTQSRRRLTKLLATYVHQHLPSFPFASLAVAHSAESGAHRDPNAGDTAVIAVGCFTGGRLFTYSEAKDAIVTHPVKNRFCVFDAKVPHGTCRFYGGPRFTVTAYRHVRSGEASARLRRRLRALGFHLPRLCQVVPSASSLTGPKRMALAKAAWRRYCKRRRGEVCVTQPGRKPGEHRASVWVCYICGSTGVQHSGRPRKICRKLACKRIDKSRWK